jgi:hypothetical protein
MKPIAQKWWTRVGYVRGKKLLMFLTLGAYTIGMTTGRRRPGGRIGVGIENESRRDALSGRNTLW